MSDKDKKKASSKKGERYPTCIPKQMTAEEAHKVRPGYREPGMKTGAEVRVEDRSHPHFNRIGIVDLEKTTTFGQVYVKFTDDSMLAEAAYAYTNQLKVIS